VTVTCGYLVDEATRSYWKLFEATVTESKLDEATCLILSLLFSVYHSICLCGIQLLFLFERSYALIFFISLHCLALSGINLILRTACLPWGLVLPQVMEVLVKIG
jgi:hypothetical protein